jgi:hypothetical protein
MVVKKPDPVLCSMAFLWSIARLTLTLSPAGPGTGSLPNELVALPNLVRPMAFIPTCLSNSSMDPEFLFC